MAGKKKAFALRLDEDSYSALEKWAGDEFRSLNGQIEYLLSQALKQSGRRKEQGVRDKEQEGNEEEEERGNGAEKEAEGDMREGA